MYKIYLAFECLPKALNIKLRSNRFKNSRENKTWDKMVFLHARFKLPKMPLEKANITIIRHSHRTLDYDGLVGSMKPVVDAIVDAGILKDDSWNVTGKWNVDQRFRPKKKGPFLEILVQETP